MRGAEYPRAGPAATVRERPNSQCDSTSRYGNGRFQCLRQVLVGCTDQTKRRVAPRVATHPFVGAFLHDPQQLGLQRHRQFADFIEKQRSAVRGCERAVTRCHRAREVAAFVPEELAAGQFRDDRRAIDYD